MNRSMLSITNILPLSLIIYLFSLSFPLFSANATGLYTPRQRFGADLVVQSNATDDTGQDMPHNMRLGWVTTDIHFTGSMGVERVNLTGIWPGANSTSGIGYDYQSYSDFRNAVQYDIDFGRNSYPDNSVFIIGNEIGYTPGVENYSPQSYVDRYIRYYSWINQLGIELGRNYKVALGSVFPLMNYHYGGINGIEYIRQVLNNYQARTGQKIPAPIFTIHPYNFGGSSTDLNVFKNQVTAFRQMMKDMGYQDRELWIAEWGNLANGNNPASSLDAGVQYLRDSTTWLMENTKDANTGLTSDENRLVQRWAWWPFNWGNWWGWNPGPESQLASEGQWSYMYNSGTKTLSVIGLAYKDLINKYAPKPTPRPGEKDLMSYLPFDEGSGSIVTDQSINENDGVFNGNVKWVDGKYGKALSFGGGSKVVLPQVIGQSSMGTMSMWVKFNSLDFSGDTKNILYSLIRTDWHDGKYEVARLFVATSPFYGPQHDFRFGIFQKPNAGDWANTWMNWASSGVTPVIGNWYHLAATWDSATNPQQAHMKIYINGELKKVITNSNAAGTPAFVGKVPPASYAFLGSSADAVIDDFRIYNRELSDGEIATLVNLPIRTPTPTSTLVPCTRKSQGDANCDGKVDGIDYSIWLNTQCHPTVSSQRCGDQRADFNGDGNVDDNDFQVWFQNRGI